MLAGNQPSSALNVEHALFVEKNHIQPTDRHVSLQDKLTKLLVPFHITDFQTLRRLMIDTGAVISGSMALAILQPEPFIPNDIDFYVLPTGFSGVLEYVQQHGYIITPYEHLSHMYDNKHLLIVKLVHPVTMKSINVVAGLGKHVVNTITQFHSTLVMNYVSWFGVVVLYPSWTLNKRGLVIKDTPVTRKCFSKYTACGFNLLHDARDLMPCQEDHICQEDPYCPQITRTLYDGHCLVEPFHATEFDFERDELNAIWTLRSSCPWSSVSSVDKISEFGEE